MLLMPIVQDPNVEELALELLQHTSVIGEWSAQGY